MVNAYYAYIIFYNWTIIFIYYYYECTYLIEQIIIFMIYDCLLIFFLNININNMYSNSISNTIIIVLINRYLNIL